MNTDPLLKVENLTVTHRSVDGVCRAVDGVHFHVNRGEAVAFVGESGSGKTCAALALTRLLPPPPTCQISGNIYFEGQSILDGNNAELRRIRGSGIAYVFQEPSTALNPTLTIGFQLAEAICLHRENSNSVADEVRTYLHTVELNDVERLARAYPHELSGGMQQRVMIAMALACRPKLLVADEPTTALDVSLQLQIIHLLKKLKQTHNVALLLITHNLSLLENFVDRVYVMFRGKIVESGAPEKLLTQPQHPYTRALVNCIPKLSQKRCFLPTIDYATINNT